MTREALIIFAKNPVAGKVKTRLAATIGNVAALKIYNELIAHTISITTDLPIDKYVFYLNEITRNDMWDDNIFFKKLQNGNNLGERMKNAFGTVFKKGYKSVVIIGTDCPALNGVIIMKAFTKLDLYDVIIGPAEDGGYYLLGIKYLYSALFENIQWSTPDVLNETKIKCVELKLDYYMLPLLNDIDEEKDLVYLKQNYG
ncbi:MAG: TIGR04282 family arsenosugar biosynthesis glycosyltransferase [Ginsengibacter sp.]